MKEIELEINDLLKIIKEAEDYALKSDIEHINEIIEFGLLEKIGDFIGGGSCGMVYKVENKYNVKKYFKVTNPEDERYIKDEMILKDLQGSYLYPKLYFAKEGEYIIKEHIEGFTFDNINKAILNGESQLDLFDFYSNLIPQLQDLYAFTISKGYYPVDLEDDNVVIREDGTICIIDVGLFEKFELKDKSSKYYKTRKEHNERLKYVREHIEELLNSVLISIILLYSEQGFNEETIKDIISYKLAI